MKMNELKLVYFSPTGTTRKVIMEAARSIDLKSTSFDFSDGRYFKMGNTIGAVSFLPFGKRIIFFYLL